MATLIAILIIISLVCLIIVNFWFLFHIEGFASLSAWLFYPFYFSPLLLVLMKPLGNLMTISGLAVAVLTVLARIILKAEAKKSDRNTTVEV